MLPTSLSIFLHSFTYPASNSDFSSSTYCIVFMASAISFLTSSSLVTASFTFSFPLQNENSNTWTNENTFRFTNFFRSNLLFNIYQQTRTHSNANVNGMHFFSGKNNDLKFQNKNFSLKIEKTNCDSIGWQTVKTNEVRCQNAVVDVNGNDRKETIIRSMWDTIFRGCHIETTDNDGDRCISSTITCVYSV